MQRGPSRAACGARLNRGQQGSSKRAATHRSEPLDGRFALFVEADDDNCVVGGLSRVVRCCQAFSSAFGRVQACSAFG
eukprot:5600784-Alexandrium_andersonii.AAC.1